MKIISVMNGHNATVGLFVNGVCLGIHHEEKFNNIKNFTGFPENAFKYCMAEIDGKVDKVVFFQNKMLSSHTQEGINDIENFSQKRKIRKIYNFLEFHLKIKFISRYLRTFIINKIISPKSWIILKNYLKTTYGIPENKIESFDHHLSHCATPIAFYGLKNKSEEVLLFSMDGSGDDLFAKVCIYDPKFNSLKEISSNTYDNSLGVLYYELTKFMGMKGGEHEYKVMGLSSYVNEEKFYKHIKERVLKNIRLDEKNLTFKSNFTTTSSEYFFRKYFVGERFDNLAAGFQSALEELVIRWIEAWIKKTGIGVIGLSGGVFMNVKLNKKISEISEVQKAYFQPACGDESHAIGAAWLISNKYNEVIKPVKSMYLGQIFSDDDVIGFINGNNLTEKYNITKYTDINNRIAELLSQFNIVARFSGRGEWGARSLGNRAILANPSNLKSFYEVNDTIKMRDFWMPFAPSILDICADQYIKNWDLVKNKVHESLKYMIVTVDATELGKKHLIGALHPKDHTFRPQICNKLDNNDYYDLLNRFYEITGIGGVLNTSLNLHGYPLVGNLNQTLLTFENSNLKFLAIENYLISKR